MSYRIFQAIFQNLFQAYLNTMFFATRRGNNLLFLKALGEKIATSICEVAQDWFLT